MSQTTSSVKRRPFQFDTDVFERGIPPCAPVGDESRMVSIDLITEARKDMASLKRDWNITILPADKGWRTVVLNTADYHTKVTDLLSDTNTYVTLRWDPTSSYNLDPDDWEPSTCDLIKWYYLSKDIKVFLGGLEKRTSACV